MTHRIRWYGVAVAHDGTRTLIPRNGGMAARDWGWDATCTCGWATRTGGAIAACIRREIEDHRLDIELKETA